MNTIKRLIGIVLVPASLLSMSATSATAEDGELFKAAYIMSEEDRAETEEAIRAAIADETGKDNSNSMFALPQEVVEGESDELSARINEAILAEQQKKVAGCNRCGRYKTVYRTRFRTVRRKQRYRVRQRRYRTVMVAKRRVRVRYVQRKRYRTVYRPVRVAYYVRRPVRRTYTTYVPRRRTYYTTRTRTRYIRRRVAYRTKTVYRRRVTYRRVSTRRVSHRRRSYKRRRTIHNVRGCRHYR